MRKLIEIIVHCSATPEGKDFTIDDIRRWHLEKGYSDIGYHFVIYRDGSIHRGRPLDQAGAHCKGHNANSIGVCYIGGLDAKGDKAKDTRTPQQIESLIELLQALKVVFGDLAIVGHHDYNKGKECPCFDVKEWVRKEEI